MIFHYGLCYFLDLSNYFVYLQSPLHYMVVTTASNCCIQSGAEKGLTINLLFNQGKADKLGLEMNFWRFVFIVHIMRNVLRESEAGLRSCFLGPMEVGLKRTRKRTNTWDHIIVFVHSCI